MGITIRATERQSDRTLRSRSPSHWPSAPPFGDDYTPSRFMDERYAAGVISVSLIRRELSGLDDEIIQIR